MKKFADGFNPNDYAALTNIGGDVMVLQHKTTQQLVAQKTISTKNENLYSQLLNLHHPNLVQILGVEIISEELDKSDETATFRTYEEYVQGETLAEIIDAADKPISQETAVNWILQLCAAINVLHSQNPPIIHRDVKPSNIIVADGVVKLLDFNAAKDVKPNQLRDTTLIGTPGYAAPEQYGYSASEPRTDIYAVGVIFAELLTGSPEIARLAKLPNRRYKKIIQNCTQLDPKRRYKNIQQLERQLHKKSRAIPLFAAGFAAGLLLLAFTIFWNNFLNSESPPPETFLAQETPAENPPIINFAEIMTVSSQPELAAALAAIPPNGTTTIVLANSIEWQYANIIIENGENITFDLVHGDLTLIANPGGHIPLWLEGVSVGIIGGGEFNIVRASNNFSILEMRESELTISNISGGSMINILQSGLTILGDLDVPVLQTSQSTVDISGNLSGSILANSTNNMAVRGNVGGDVNLRFGENRITVGGDIGGSAHFELAPEDFQVPQGFPLLTDELTIGGTLHGEIIFTDSDRTEDLRQLDDYDEIVEIAGRSYFVFRDNSLRGDFRVLWLAE
ncbi:MAG: serine/threonine protein kinase [Defluviitaleaceae bacterium]|nr:serine/threonine protein kinase [Defluviitaleaceae bacterium]